MPFFCRYNSGMTKVPISDGGWFIKLATGAIVRFDARGREVERLRPGDVCYSHWLTAVEVQKIRDQGRDPYGK